MVQAVDLASMKVILDLAQLQKKVAKRQARASAMQQYRCLAGGGAVPYQLYIKTPREQLVACTDGDDVKPTA